MAARKIVVTGPESTGKSTLSAALAASLQTVWVPEYARAYLDEIGRPYTEDDLLTMAQGQIKLEDELAKQADNYLVCDTDLHVMRVWSENKYGRCHPWILEQIATRRYDLYLLCYIDTPWEDDPQREHPSPDRRAYFYQQYKDAVMNSGVPWEEIKGSPGQRLERALEIIKKTEYAAAHTSR